MVKGRDTIPGPGIATDGITRLPGRRITRHRNWEQLKREFLLNDEFMNIRSWLHHVKGWPVKEIMNGNVSDRIKGWSKEKEAVEKKRTEKAIQAMMDEQRRRMPTLLAAKLLLVTKVIGSVSKWDYMQPADKKLCYEILKNELNEPTRATGDDNGTVKDPVEALLEEYGLMQEGRIIIDAEPEPGESISDSEPATAISSRPPIEAS